MFSQGQPFVISEIRKATGVADFTINAHKKNPEDLYQLTRISVVNETSAGTLADVGVVVGNRQVFYETLVLTTAGYWYPSSMRVLLSSECKVMVRCRNPNAGDVFKVNVFGYIIPKDG